MISLTDMLQKIDIKRKKNNWPRGEKVWWSFFFFSAWIASGRAKGFKLIWIATPYPFSFHDDLPSHGRPS